MKKNIFLSLFAGLALAFHAQTDTSRTSGKVSHMYKKGGCPTVILLSASPEQILIPKDKLPKDLDKDGLIVFFNYRKLRSPNPKGCVKGNVAEITNITKKK